MIKSIEYDSNAGDKIKAGITSCSEPLKDGILNKISSDFGVLSSLGIFSAQLSGIESAVKELVNSYESFASTIAESTASWKTVAADADQNAKEFFNAVDAGVAPRISYGNGGGHSGGSYSGGGGTNSTADNSDPNINTVDKGKDISAGDIKLVLSKIDSSTLPILLQKIHKLSSEEDMYSLLTDDKKSEILTTILKKILGDPSKENTISSDDKEAIQKLLLEKIKEDGIDPTTEEGRAKLKEYLESKLNQKVDDSVWDKLLYGNNTKKIDCEGSNWIVIKGAQDVKAYSNAVAGKVSQSADPETYGDKCLSFAYAHQKDLYTGGISELEKAGNYKTPNISTTYVNDSKEETLAKIYDEIMHGRPVILQVNGKNLRGQDRQVRHFVTVVGFKEGVVCGASLDETDLLILDSYDGKLERMDTPNSRYMTTGAQCRKDYTGYRLGIIKSVKG